MNSITRIRSRRGLIDFVIACACGISLFALRAPYAEDKPEAGKTPAEKRDLSMPTLPEFPALKGRKAVYWMPDIKGMTVAEFVQSEPFSWLQSCGIRVIFERDRTNVDNEIEGKGWRITGYSTLATSGECVVIKIVGPVFAN
jgi:hypothetical protein